MGGPEWLQPGAQTFTLGELHHWHVVKATCGACGHSAPVDHGLLKHGRSLTVRVSALTAKMRCTECGKRGASAMWVKNRER